MILYNLGVENHPAGTVGLNAIVNGNWDKLDGLVSPSEGLTASQTGTTVTASSSVFTSDDVGATIRFADGTTRIITVFTSGTQVTVGVSGAVASQSFKLYRTDQTQNDGLMRGLTKRVRMLSSDDGKFFFWDNTAKRLKPATGVSYNSGSDQAQFGDGTTSAPSIAHAGDLNTGIWFPAADVIAISVNAVEQLRVAASLLTLADALNVALGTGTGTKIGTATSQKLGFWNAAPIVQPTTAGAAATFVANTSGIVNDSATFDGYTLGQVVKALRNAGILA